MSPKQQRRGYCPRVWTPMRSGDGLIVRVHAASRWFTSAAVEQLAALSERHGSGHIDITRRANLQLRGVAPDSLAELQQELVRAQLADPSVSGERRFALLVSPFVGLDPGCAALLTIARTLEDALSSSAAPAELHPKLAIVLDGPERALRGLHADIRVELEVGAVARAALYVAAGPRQEVALGTCALAAVPNIVLGWLSMLANVDAEPLRMHALIAARGASLLLTNAIAPLTSRDRPEAGSPLSLVGHHAAAEPWFGVMLPFGSGDAQQWRAIAALARDFGTGQLRAHPRRGLLLHGVAAQHSAPLRHAAIEAGFIVEPNEPLLQVVACTGSPACSSAWGETRSLARALSQSARPLLEAGATMHVSGCEKSCSWSGPSEIVLVHTEQGMRLAYGRDAAGAASAPLVSRAELEAALSASAQEYATSAPERLAKRKPP